ncbi:transcriptional regulator, TetR family [Chthoniobacter flavus Ellin428]|uniref:Transcriptional regulator, TetR family n=1 Tax=Chthoniobacter flavus Ellin428 TaxID=497964 RepID=B4D1F8_9BACT|nr:TetR/AcrR family transcriptional regulator [Chthoniobacter flavus]EDY19570.1 transcriptional regulator, TetR family [Chthoniobacter flavus Ellin428]TCO92813.1 TetR family transcriptional regulator [Chthoniobacter flavus]
MIHGAIQDHLATRIALLDAAERLFSQNGIEATSVRDIIKEAGTNLGAINYHFGTKDRLALEVFARRIRPVNRERIARLDALEATTDPSRITLAQVLDALIRPALESEAFGAKSCDDFMRLLSRSSQEPNAEVKKFVEEQFAEMCGRFDAAILRVVPGLPPSELFWRVSFLHGALNNALQTWLRFEQIPYAAFSPAASKPDREGLIQRLIAFIAGGLSAAWDEAAVPAAAAQMRTITFPQN